MKHTTVVISLLCIIALFFAGRHCIFLGSSVLGTLSSCVLYPVLRVQQLIIEPIQCLLKQRASLKDLQHICAALRDECELLRLENIALKGTCSYAEDVGELVSYKKRYDLHNAHVTQVLARHLSTNNQFFLVDVGLQHGIKKDMVALYKNCLVGKVVEVYPWYSKVCLVTDNECKVAAFCVDTGASGIVEGVYSKDTLFLQYVSHLSNVQENDTVLSSGEGLVFPRGFGLGTITSAVKGDLYYTITVKPFLDFESIRYCLLLGKSDVG